MKPEDILQIIKEERANVLRELSDAMLRKVIIEEFRAVLKEDKISKLKGLINMATQTKSPHERKNALLILKKMGFNSVEAARAATLRPTKQEARRARRDLKRTPSTKKGILDFIKRNKKVRVALIALGGIGGFLGAGGTAQASPRKHIENEVGKLYDDLREKPWEFLPVVGEVTDLFHFLTHKMKTAKTAEHFKKMYGDSPVPYGGDLL